MTAWRAAIAACLMYTLGTLPVLAAPADGSISGQVLNKTAGGSPTGGTPVILVSFGRKEQAPLGQKTTPTDGDGRYSFTSLDRDPNIVYFTLARFQNVNYPTDQPVQLQDQPNAASDIGVYDATTSDDAIKLENLNLLVLGADQGLLQFMEMGALVNAGDRTFVTANPQDQALARALKFALPSGAVNVQMQAGFTDQDVIPGVGGIQVTSPVPPGRHQFALSFQLPYSGSSADVGIQLPYATDTFSVYLPDTGIKLESSPLAARGPAQMGGQSYSLFSATNLSRDTLIGGQLSRLGAPGGLPSNELALISLGVVLSVIGGGVALFGGRLRRRVRPATRPAAYNEHERLELVVRLAALDERFAAGEVSQADYSTERERGKQRLRELTLAYRAPSAVSEM